MDKIKILKVEPGKPPCVKEIANDFKASQAEVEGDIECVGFGDGCVAVINAEGKLNGMRPNRRNGDDIICGAFLSVGIARTVISFLTEQRDRRIYKTIWRD